MATPVPLLISEVRPDSTMYSVKVTQDPSGTPVPGSEQTFDESRFYFGVSPATSAADRQSLLRALKTALDASTGGAVVWTVRLSSTFKLILSHDNATYTHRVTFYSSAGGAGSSAHMLLWGFQNYSNPNYLTYVDVPTGGSGMTADFKPRWLWTPGVPVHHTGPEGGFDPALDYGVPSSAGSIQRSQDGTTVAVDNGVLYDAEYECVGVAGLYRIRPDPTLVYRNEDLDGWWQAGPAKGRRILWWRDGQNAIGSDAPSGSGTPDYCIEYAPQESLKNGFPAQRMSTNGTYYWNVRFALYVTERGDAIPGA